MTTPVLPTPPIPPDLLILHSTDPLAPVSSPLRYRDTVIVDLAGSSPVVNSGKKELPPAAPSSKNGSIKSSSSPPSSIVAPTADVGLPGYGKTVESSESASANPSSLSNSADLPSKPSKEFNWAAGLKSSCKIPESNVVVTTTPEGVPRVKVPNAVFKRGAKLHSDYIVGIFYGNPPSYGKIWGVLNYLWGKDRKVTIHNLTPNAFLFRIPSASLRNKVLQHELWRVGDSPFFVTEWKASFSLDPPSLKKAPIWATITNIPFDLVTDEGLSIIAKPLGKIVDKKPFTSVNSAEVKVIVDLTSTLPTTTEIERDDGQIVVLSVTYPWLPPLCSVCNEIGHKALFCPVVKKPKSGKVNSLSSGQSVQKPSSSGKSAQKQDHTPNIQNSASSGSQVWVEKQKSSLGNQVRHDVVSGVSPSMEPQQNEEIVKEKECAQLEPPNKAPPKVFGDNSYLKATKENSVVAFSAKETFSTQTQFQIAVNTTQRKIVPATSSEALVSPNAFDLLAVESEEGEEDSEYEDP
ncbi:unnamed protein product [Microthlaspi erraticum]|uniref:DUF4283 domain-containing protein n=1 Tax=Microthlaspi erraticum TaxID=1685480 RepID=A0A6D2L7A1_9BRAS|nr:unnamed protein product [Microthlaspi erraticum]